VPSDVVVTSSSPARTYPIPREVVEQALQGVRWARAYGTDVPEVHQYSAALLAAGGPVDVVELNRLNRMFAAASALGTGWQPGDDGYPCRELILSSLAGGEQAREWTERVLSGIEEEQRRSHAGLLSTIGYDHDHRYVGICASGDPDIVTDIARTKDGAWEIWHPRDGWESADFEQISTLHAVEPDTEMLAEIVAAISAGDRLLLSYADPVAFLPAVLATTGMPTEVEGAATYALVDEIDSTAVLDVLRISGESVSVRAGGQWVDEGTTSTWLRKDFPDTLVEMDEDTARNVLAQVDSIHEPTFQSSDIPDTIEDSDPQPAHEVLDLVASIDTVFADVIESIGSEDSDRDREHDRTLLASVERIHELTTLWARRDLYRSSVNGHVRLDLDDLPFVAAGPALGGADRNRGGAERLRRYWTRGKGALKIRWGTKGDWRRCYRQLFKYMGPRAAGYCQLRHGERTGLFTGDKLHRAGVNAVRASVNISPEYRDKLVEIYGESVIASANAEAATGIMVALYPDPNLADALALDGGEAANGLHVTLAYLGQLDEQTEGPDSLIERVTDWASRIDPLVGQISGVGRFNAGPGSEQPVVYASVDIPALPEAREMLVGAIDGGPYFVNKLHGYTPHMSLAYGNVDLNSLDIPTIETAFPHVSIVWGETRHDVPFGSAAV
jgi:2'-5' RNA ligase